MKIINENKVLDLMKEKFNNASVKFHPDDDNTFAAYQITLRGENMEVWINARNGDVIYSGSVINRIR